MPSDFSSCKHPNACRAGTQPARFCVCQRDDDRIDVRSLPTDTFAKTVEAMRNQPDGMTTEQWLVLVDAGILPAGPENAFVEFSEDPETQSWTVQARWIEFPDAV